MTQHGEVKETIVLHILFKFHCPSLISRSPNRTSLSECQERHWSVSMINTCRFQASRNVRYYKNIATVYMRRPVFQPGMFPRGIPENANLPLKICSRPQFLEKKSTLCFYIVFQVYFPFNRHPLRGG